MPKVKELTKLVEKFAADLEEVVAQRTSAEFASRFDELRRSILGGAAKAPTLRLKKPNPRAGIPAELKPCPICGEPNKARRFSYLCENDRTPENLAKFRGATLKRGRGAQPAAAPEAATKAKPAPAAAKRGKAGRKAKA